MLYPREENKGMTELPKTEQELNDLITARIKEETEKLVSKHNGEMATMRQKYDAEVKKAKEQANMTAEELAQQKVKEQNEETQRELADLRAYKKSAEISARLSKEGLPSYFKNDTRLLSAEDGDLDKVIKDVKKEYEQTLPKGATKSTVVQTSTGGKPQGSGTSKEEQQAQAFDSFGKQLNDLIGKD